MAEPLSETEAAELARYEQTIKKGIEVFCRVGAALCMIRNDKLYRMTHGTFGSYCQQQWLLTPHYAETLTHLSEVLSGQEKVEEPPVAKAGGKVYEQTQLFDSGV